MMFAVAFSLRPWFIRPLIHDNLSFSRFVQTCHFPTNFKLSDRIYIQTPNRTLDIDDIPSNEYPLELNDGVENPENSRYTAQYLELPGRSELRTLPDNSDAAFGKTSRLGAKKPSALLLHYNYGIAAVKLWGRKTHILEDKAKEFRPPKPVPCSSTIGPSLKGPR